MAFRKKYHSILEMKPELLILQECENVENLSAAFDPNLYNEIYWFGENPHKGVAVINFTSSPLSFETPHNKKFKHVIPFFFKGIQFFAIWAMPHKVKARSYVGQVWGAINHYNFDSDGRYILMGDFNSHVQWDHERKVGNHSALVGYLEERGIVSLYHSLNGLEPGEERLPTQFMYRHEDKPYHLDYCFVSNGMVGKESKIEIGDFGKWREWSDHMPLIVDIVDE